MYVSTSIGVWPQASQFSNTSRIVACTSISAGIEKQKKRDAPPTTYHVPVTTRNRVQTFLFSIWGAECTSVTFYIYISLSREHDTVNFLVWVGAALGGSVHSPHCKCNEIKNPQLSVPIAPRHGVVKSSRLDLYTEGLVVSVWLKTAPRSEHLLASSVYRKFDVRGFSQCGSGRIRPKRTCMVTDSAALAHGDLPGR